MGPKILMDTWRNPHHNDRAAYATFRKNATLISRLTEWLRVAPTRFIQRLRRAVAESSGLDDPNEPSAATARRDPNTLPTPRRSRDEELSGHRLRSSYILERLPKKSGERLTVNFPATSDPEDYPDDDNHDRYPDGWGVLLEEKFHVHGLLTIILILFSVFYIIVIYVYGRKFFESQKPGLTEAEIISICALSLAEIGLLTNVWIKWAENYSG